MTLMSTIPDWSAKIVSVLTEHLDYSRPVGWSTRAKECPNCEGTGNSPAVQITRKEDGWLWSCHRCRNAGQKHYSGFFPDTKASPDEVKKIVAQMDNPKHKDNRPEVVTLPEDMSSTLPPKALVYLYDRYFEPATIGRFGIGWSQQFRRTVFPVYKYMTVRDQTSKVDGYAHMKQAKKLVGWTGRKLEDDTSEKPKWHSVRQRDIKHPRFIAPPEVWDTKKRVVLVEDVISAIRISCVGIMSIALMTTYLPYELYNVLRGWDVRVWLDDDAYDKSIGYFSKLNGNGVQAQSIHTKKDPKDLSPEEIEEELTWLI